MCSHYPGARPSDAAMGFVFFRKSAGKSTHSLHHGVSASQAEKQQQQKKRQRQKQRERYRRDHNSVEKRSESRTERESVDETLCVCGSV